MYNKDTNIYTEDMYFSLVIYNLNFFKLYLNTIFYMIYMTNNIYNYLI